MNIPNTNHFAIITEKTVYIEGDERSKTHPGHGYPASNETFLEYHAFTDEKKWVDEIERLTDRKIAFKAIKASPVKVTVAVKIT